MAGRARCDEHALRRRFRGSSTDTIMKIISSHEAYKCSLFQVTEDEAVDKKGGFQIKRSVVRHAGSAVMMAVDDKKRILLVRQYRLPADKYLWEVAAG